ncbi:MAG: hypothetical protein AMJ69_08150 [Gammaproteobacteria bacterium SG8_47]|nr:MAG: hypothetical protein AMJ69_08150 [Gammaproteobacteria bacterium SG8_47]
MLRYVIVLLLAFSAVQVVFAGEPKEIHLKDGAVIKGTVQAFDGERYTVQTDTLGTLHVHESHIAAIVVPSALASLKGQHSDQGAVYSPGDLAAMQQRLLRDEELRAMIESLQANPQIQAIIDDPQLMQAIYSGDLTTLQQDPRIQSLMNDPTVQRIQSKALSAQ